MSRLPGSEAHDDQRVLVVAPAGKDAALVRDVLATHGVGVAVCANIDGMCAEWERGAGVLLVTEESLAAAGLERLEARLAQQPPWSDIPVLVFLSGASTREQINRVRALRNVTVLERPIRIVALVSTINAALRARLRQYELRDLMRELRDANRAKDDFLAMVSHELRTPLNVIRGVSQMLVQQHVEPGRVPAAAERIARNADVLCRLVDDLLDLSRLQKRRFQLKVAPVDLAAVATTAVEMNRLAAEAKDVRLEVRIAPLGRPVLGDAVRLEQIVSNLVSNGIKFTPPQGTVSVSLTERDGTAEIVVSDTGEGIGPDFLPYVFEPFRQAGDTGTRTAGLGLGLAIVRQFVELHGGTIKAASGGHGHGATFTVVLPLARTEKPAGVPTVRGTGL